MINLSGLFLPLFFWPASAATELPRKPKSDYLVQGLEEVEPAFSSIKNGTMYAGLIPFDYETRSNTNKHRKGEFLFWLFLNSDDGDESSSSNESS